MAVELTCRLRQSGDSMVVELPLLEGKRAYVLFDALQSGFLRSFRLRDGERAVSVTSGAEDCFSEDALQLSEGSIGCIRRMLFDAMMRPGDAAWLHVDIETEKADVVIGFERNS